jgi:hypothetical protein
VTVNGTFTVLPLSPAPKPDPIAEMLAQLRTVNPRAASDLELLVEIVVNDLVQAPARNARG